eukprot:2897487-Ditylum_brightwellii.AAC.1
MALDAVLDDISSVKIVKEDITGNGKDKAENESDLLNPPTLWWTRILIDVLGPFDMGDNKLEGGALFLELKIGPTISEEFLINEKEGAEAALEKGSGDPKTVAGVSHQLDFDVAGPNTETTTIVTSDPQISNINGKIQKHASSEAEPSYEDTSANAKSEPTTTVLQIPNISKEIPNPSTVGSSRSPAANTSAHGDSIGGASILHALEPENCESDPDNAFLHGVVELIFLIEANPQEMHKNQMSSNIVPI